MFSHNGANGPQSKTTLTFRPVRQVAALGRSLPYQISNCMLFAFRVFVNRSLHMKKIKFFGFDMDYTLAGRQNDEVSIVVL